MAPAEVEFKSGWAIFLPPEKRKVKLAAGEQRIFTPFQNLELSVYCVASDDAVNVTLRDKTYQLGEEYGSYPVTTVIVKKNESVVIKNQSLNKEVALIKHTSKKEAK